MLHFWSTIFRSMSIQRVMLRFEVGFPFRIIFLFHETQSKAKQTNCFTKFHLFREIQNLFRFVFREMRNETSYGGNPSLKWHSSIFTYPKDDVWRLLIQVVCNASLEVVYKTMKTKHTYAGLEVKIRIYLTVGGSYLKMSVCFGNFSTYVYFNLSKEGVYADFFYSDNL
jgi:hypothetical protein